ncbi:hypothetical protein J9978_07265 [Chromobacterium violaceum]|uniref:hypothetical protein n=1 Tax=Chromobacterium violaceum TaxID=536 RepID=UPI001B338BA1|nr:hypothetical protein [Chromobacterium violaceum]MBP4049295.1 hypothetical protein [Chromobacterium violaceum]
MLHYFADYWLQPERVGGLLLEWRKQLAQRKNTQQDKLAEVQKSLADIEARQARLLEAIETGRLPANDPSISSRLSKLKAEREAQLLELSGMKREQAVPVEKISDKSS